MGIRHKYEKVEGKLSDIVSMAENGEELWVNNGSKNSPFYTPVFGGQGAIAVLYKRKIVCKRVKEEWFDVIPKGGVLCWVGFDKDDMLKKRAVCDVSYYNDGFGAPYQTGDKVGVKCATPLTRSEIQVFMDNAPEE